ncbi:PLP-dependent aminotransferase family protein [Rhodococcus triatomae]|uniref:GntR family transcriptional regulator / MocR family aminotransferase n=1 Tax=Rhodococcus triatomae TaxID=300028 RepID=A0A1G8DIB8_9NOCA|nr:PLP-dependent aminotransferase family protein [Rhodococcus triatomae]QNG18423.1 PLP-dependent aminotransferase family protein [Rhodococcus triatomae]QNG21907.1 PLP-dependent aminotransferase family protein [Rhodococcus triatomae]SDH57422.1 GntR family transcriptional regulator / MocR family aminotransferase [Rhodococcus triatomae]
MARTPVAAHVPLTITDDGTPLRHRIATGLIAEIRAGRLQSGDPLPSTRTLALQLGVSRGPVVEAFDELVAAGYVIVRPGSGTRVAAGAATAARAHADPPVPLPRKPLRRPTPPPAPTEATRAAPEAPAFDLVPGHPDPGLVSVRDWRRAWRSAASAPIDAGVPAADGCAELRNALAHHLRRTRAITAHPDEIVVVPGVSAAVRALAAAAGLRTHTVAFENPGYTRARRILEASGVQVRSVPVDADGLDPRQVRPSDRAVYCTPAHQYPTGARMPVTRRTELVDRCRETAALVLEDDYDGEFRYGATPLPALRSIDGGSDCVAYIGTASKILTPSIRIAWVLPPPHLLSRLRDEVDASAERPCAVTALALAQFVTTDALTRHLARAARTYSARRTAFVDALEQVLPPGVGVSGIEAGLHVLLDLPAGTDDRALADDLARHGVAVPALSAYDLDRTGTPGLVCGYARLPETSAGDAAGRIAHAVRRHLPVSP